MTADEWRSFATHPCFIEARKLADTATSELVESHIATRYADPNATHSSHSFNAGWMAGVQAFNEFVKEKCDAE